MGNVTYYSADCLVEGRFYPLTVCMVNEATGEHSEICVKVRAELGAASIGLSPVVGLTCDFRPAFRDSIPRTVIAWIMYCANEGSECAGSMGDDCNDAITYLWWIDGLPA